MTGGEVLQNNSEKYRNLFEGAPISLWAEDWSGVKVIVDNLRAGGIDNIGGYLDERPDVALQMSSAIRILDTNSASLKTYGAATKEELVSEIGRRLKQRPFHNFPSRIGAFVEHETPMVFEGADRRMCGEQMYTRITVQIPDDRWHDWSWVNIVVEDITTHRQAEIALRKSEARLRAIMDNAPMGISLKDTEGRYLEVNRRFEVLWGITNEDARGKLPEDVVGRKELATMIQDLDLAILDSGEIAEREIEAEIDGSLHILRTVKFPVYGDDNAAVGLGAITTDVTVHRLAERALAEKSALLDGLVANSPVNISIKTPAGHYIHINPEFERAFGVSNGKVKGRTLDSVYPKEFADEYATEDRKVLRTLTPSIREEAVPHVDGTTHTYLSSRFPVLNSVGEPTAIALMEIDITKRKQTEEAFRQRGALMRQASAMANLGHWVWDEAEGRCVYCSETLARMNGVSVEEFLVKFATEEDHLKDVHPDDYTRYSHIIANAKREMRAYDVEFRCIMANRGYRYMREIGEPILDENGRLVRTIGTLQDVTEYKHAQDASRQSERRYRDIFENAVEGIYRTMPDGRYLSVNPALARMHGCETPEIFMVEFPSGEDVYATPGARDELTRTMRTEGFVYGFECEANKCDGSRFWMSESGRAVWGDNGELLGYEGFVQDITERKQMEEQLHQAQKLEAIGRLTGGVAHEFNNQLFAISGFARYLQRSNKISSAEKPYLDNIVSAADQAASLTRQLLAFSRRQALVPLVIPVSRVVQETKALLRPMAGESVRIIFELVDGGACVKVDPGQLSQALLNLAINACDAMTEGGTLTISTGRETLDATAVAPFEGAEPGDYVTMAVTDTGSGIDPKSMEQIFEPFFTTKEVGEGTGLGLSMVYGMTKQSGGIITVNSRLGEGTTFTIYLPLVVDMSTATEKHGSMQSVPTGNETILIAEDEPRVQRLTQNMLEELGYTVLVATDGIEGIRTFREYAGRVDLLLADLKMPNRGGRQLARMLSAERADLKVIYMTGYDCSPTELQKEGQGDEVILLHKPFDLYELGHAVRAVLDTQYQLQ